MATDAQTPTGPPDMVRTRQLFIGPNHAAREAVVSADAATGPECELPSLVIISGRHRGRRIPVPSTGIVLGREGRLAPFFRDDPLASRGHAQVYVADNRSVQVADLNSTNGTFVNGEAISSLTRLAGQDVLRIGSIEMRLDPPGTGAQPADESLRLHDIRASLARSPGRAAGPARASVRGGPPGLSSGCRGAGCSGRGWLRPGRSRAWRDRVLVRGVTGGRQIRRRRLHRPLTTARPRMHRRGGVRSGCWRRARGWNGIGRASGPSTVKAR